MNNPYEWVLEQYVNNPPPEGVVCEERNKNMNIALLQSVAWEQGYKEGSKDAAKQEA